MDSILCLKYNNYYNNMVKKEDFLADYINKADASEWVYLTNFLPGDGLFTSDHWNWTHDWLPDYIVRYSEPQEIDIGGLDKIDDITLYDFAGNQIGYAWITDWNSKYISRAKGIINVAYWSESIEYSTGYAAKSLRLSSVGYVKDLSMRLTDIKDNTEIEFELESGETITWSLNEEETREITGKDLTNILPTDYILNINISNPYGGSDVFTLPSEISFVDYNNTAQPVDRWFVTHTERTRQGQYKFDFVRDLMVDYYDEIISAPCHIDRATVSEDSNLIYNSEGFSFNQIKTSEFNIEDTTKTPWIVGYLPADLEDKTGSFNMATVEAIPIVDSGGNLISSDEWEFINGVRTFNQLSRWNFNLDSYRTKNGYEYIKKGTVGCEYNGTTGTNYQELTANLKQLTIRRNTFNGIIVQSETQFDEIMELNRTDWFSYDSIKDYLVDLLSLKGAQAVTNLLSYKNKLVEFSDGVYKVTVKPMKIVGADTSSLTSSKNASGLSTYMYTTIENKVRNISPEAYYEDNDNSMLNLRVYCTVKNYEVVLERYDTSVNDYQWSIPATSRVLNDNPYKMFAIPLVKEGVTSQFPTLGGEVVTTDSDVNLALAMSIARNLVSNQEIYDLQILPYCPIESVNRYSNGNLVFSGDLSLQKDITWVTQGDVKKSYILFASTSTFTKIMINQTIEVEDIKISNECDMYRLCSPNYASIFEFSAAKNRGVEGWNIYCTYKPYSPYIQVAPVFNGLYGQSFDDFRGLLCSGDFSLPLVDSAWTTYELNNKNYQNSFDRQIQNMDTLHKYDKIESITSAVAGTFQGAAAGSAAGAITGGPVGAMIGGGIGTAASAAGGIADIVLLEKRYKENKDYMVDSFEFQLDNIKALPTTLSKVSSLVANFRFFPFVEYYTCTDEEKSILKNYLKYKGMTVNSISSIQNYLQDDYSYIQGQLIRQENSNMDYYELLEVTRKLSEGVYIK